MKSVLIIEDDPAILLGLESALEDEYEVITASDGEVGLALAKKKYPDLILLDVMLPHKDGYKICKELRDNNIDIPIIMLTAKKEENDRIEGFNAGADDYVMKPFNSEELLLRIRVQLKRSANLISNEIKEPEKFSFGKIIVEVKKMDAFKDGAPCNLSVKEFNVLKYLILKEGEVVTRNELLDQVWGYDAFPTTRTVDNYILTLRKKVEDDPANPKHIVTVPTAGYRFHM